MLYLENYINYIFDLFLNSFYKEPKIYISIALDILAIKQDLLEPIFIASCGEKHFKYTDLSKVD
jgi:hypothetical protein